MRHYIGLHRFVSDPVNGGSFTAAHPKWKKDLWRAWEEYTLEQYGEWELIHLSTPANISTGSDASGDESDSNGQPALEIGEDGLPKLPEQGDLKLAVKKKVFREYVTAMYSRSCSSPFRC